jgi:thiol-disulfide isomerase/thioredoxin
MQIVHSPYNDLVMQVNLEGPKVFATNESRKTGGAAFLADLNRLDQMIRSQMSVHPKVVPNFQAMLRMHDIDRLALDDSAMLQSSSEATARGGAAAAAAAIDRAAADWLDSGQDSAAQGEALDKLVHAIAASGQDAGWMFWNDLLQYKKPLSEPVGTPLIAYLTRYDGQPGCVGLTSLERHNRQMSLEGNEVTIASTLISGQHFSTADWKGKVVYIDLWATWCAPCVANLPNIQAMYEKHHAEGLEVLGISCDDSPAPLKTFLARHPDITFPQMYDTAHHNFEHDVSFRLGVQSLSIPMMIDRKGRMHYWTKPDETTEAAVQRLLAEAP